MTNISQSTGENKKIDMKIKLKFKREYEKLKDEGKITEKEYKQICELIEDIGKYSLREFNEKIVEIFPNSPVKELIEND